MKKISKRLKNLEGYFIADIKQALKTRSLKGKTSVAQTSAGLMLAVEAETGKMIAPLGIYEAGDFLEAAEKLLEAEFKQRYKHNLQDEMRNHENVLALYLLVKSSDSQTKKSNQSAGVADRNGKGDLVSPTVVVN